MGLISVLSESGLRRIYCGATVGLAGSGVIGLFKELSPTVSLRLIYAEDDIETERLIIIRNERGETLLPAELAGASAASIERILSLYQRSQVFPLVLPRGWRQYKHDNMVAFSAASNAEGSARWIAEIRPQGSDDLAMWRITTSAEQERLEHFTSPGTQYHDAVVGWRAAYRGAMAALQGPVINQGATDIELEGLARDDIAKNRRLSAWIPELTPKQLEFFEAPTSKAIRLRGPAGSGKTLTMALKAVHTAQEAIDRQDSNFRALFATHSWSLAGEVDELVGRLSEYGNLESITVLPLVSVAQLIIPEGMTAKGLQLIGDDSLSGKRLQLGQIEEVIDEFRESDWLTFKQDTSAELSSRVESRNPDDARSFAWDCLIEFGCVLGAEQIFPGYNSEARYLKLPRTPWMMPLNGDADKRVVFALYSMFWRALQERRLITPDQLLNDLLNYLETFAWNHRRTTEGYDLIFVDEFHLFNTQEREVVRYLTKDVVEYPKILMASDPRQSPWEVFAAETARTFLEAPAEGLEDIRTVDMRTVHRASPQVLGLVKYIDEHFPTSDLAADWDMSLADAESAREIGPIPVLHLFDSHPEEEIAVFSTLEAVYASRQSRGGGLAIAVVNEDRYPAYMALSDRISTSGKFRVHHITSREETLSTKLRSRSVVMGPAEYLAGLQFDTVFVVGLPDLSPGLANQSYRRRRSLSLLYLAVSRAERDLRIFANHDDGGVPEILLKAKDKGLLGSPRR